MRVKKTIEEKRAYHRQWRRDHPENQRRYAAQTAAWQKRNPDRVAATQARYKAKNPRAQAEATLRWQKRNPDKVSVLNRRRKAKRRNQTHPLIDWKKVSEVALLCWRMTVETGVKWHVDHIIPLDAPGWHHHDNLQVIPDRLNILKSNDPFWEHPDYKSWRNVPCFLWPDRLKATYAGMLV